MPSRHTSKRYNNKKKMAMDNAHNTGSSRQEFVYTRVVDAPRKLVWEVYTQAEHLQNWWGPKGMTVQVERFELRPGGDFLYSIAIPSGGKMYGKLAYREIASPEKLVFVVSFTDAEGNPTRHPLSATWPLEVLNVVTFTEENGKTTIHMVGTPINATAEEHTTFHSSHDGMNKGTDGMMEGLEAYLAKITQ